MPTRIAPTFVVKSWDERPLYEGEHGRKLTHARMVYQYSGDLEGESTSECLMWYRDATGASFVGLERFDGRLQGKAGSFVLQGSGIFENGVATSTAHVVAGSGTGELERLRGELRSSAGHLDRYPIAFEFDFEGGGAKQRIDPPDLPDPTHPAGYLVPSLIRSYVANVTPVVFPLASCLM